MEAPMRYAGIYIQQVGENVDLGQFLNTDLDLEVFSAEGLDEDINTDEILQGNYAEKAADSGNLSGRERETQLYWLYPNLSWIRVI